MIAVDGDDGGGDEAWGLVRNAEEEIGLAAVELAENVGDGEEVAFAIDEEGVAVEEVAIAARAGRVVHLIDDGAEGEGEGAVVEHPVTRRGRGGGPALGR